MKCDRIQDLFADEWSGALDAGSRARLKLHLSECASCREEWESLNRLWTRLGAIRPEEPGPGVRPRFYAMLEGYQHGMGQARIVPSHRARLSEWFALQPAGDVLLLASSSPRQIMVRLPRATAPARR